MERSTARFLHSMIVTGVLLFSMGLALRIHADTGSSGYILSLVLGKLGTLLWSLSSFYAGKRLFLSRRWNDWNENQKSGATAVLFFLLSPLTTFLVLTWELQLRSVIDPPINVSASEQPHH